MMSIDAIEFSSEITVMSATARRHFGAGPRLPSTVRWVIAIPSRHPLRW
jgi:hypothetical protein